MDEQVVCCMTHTDYKNCPWRNDTDPQGTACYPILKEKCKIGTNMFTYGSCKKWCEANKEECTSFLTQMCNDPAQFNNGFCKDWCSKNMGLCDLSVGDWCSKYNDPLFCSCIQSPLKAFNSNPLCHDGNCLQGGYATADMIATKVAGCSKLDCQVYQDLKTLGKSSVLSDTSLETSCANYTPPEPAPIPLTFYERIKPLIKWIILLVIILIILIIAIIWTLKKNKDFYMPPNMSYVAPQSYSYPPSPMSPDMTPSFNTQNIVPQ